MSELDDIRAFVEVAESGSFSRAAKRLGISKSIVSRRVVRLESDLGAQLLNRTTRAVIPTEAGLAYKLRAEKILVDLDHAREAVAQNGDEAVGLLRISAPLTFGVKHIAPVLAELAARWPRLQIDAAYSDRLVDVIGERFDAAVRIGSLPDSTLVARRLAPIRGTALASPDYLARRGRPETPADLARHDALLYTGTPNGESWRFQDGRRVVSVHVEGRIRSDSSEALLEAAAAGLGVVIVPTFLASPYIEDGRLEGVLLDYPIPEIGLYLVRPPSAYVQGKVRVLTDTLVQRFGGEPYWDACQMKERMAAAG